MRRIGFHTRFFAAIATPLAALAFSMATPAHAGDDDKVPYWASVDAEIANLRVGPGDSYRIDWVYRRPHLPVKVIRREGSWRLIEDPDGARGWMRDLLLSRQRGGLVRVGKGELVDIRAEPSGGSRLLWKVESGVVGLLGECKDGWCPFDADGHKGFVREKSIWGTGAP